MEGLVEAVPPEDHIDNREKFLWPNMRCGLARRTRDGICLLLSFDRCGDQRTGRLTGIRFPGSPHVRQVEPSHPLRFDAVHFDAGS